MLIIGAGEIGSALARVLRKKANLTLWDRNPRLCSGEKKLRLMAKDSDYVFLCVPSHAIKTCALDIKTALPGKAIVISLTKGIERATARFTSEFLEDTFGRQRIALLAGPMLAEELRRNLPTRAVLAGSKSNFKKAAALFEGTNVKLEHSEDLQGISVSSVLKNVYAVGLGISDGLRLGANARGVLMSKAISEMRSIVKSMKGDEASVFTLAGIGDLEATGSSPHSLNYATGKRLAKSSRAKVASEGTLSLPMLLKRVKDLKQLPFLSAIKAVVIGKKPARPVFTRLAEG